MYDLVLKDGLIMDGYSTFSGDLAIAGETIVAIGRNLSGTREIPVMGKIVMPGALDVHTHFSLPFGPAVSSDDFFTGTRAASAGGVTTIIDFLSQKPGEGIQEGFRRRLAEAQNAAVIDFGFHSCIGSFNPSVERDLPWAAANGLTSLKVFMAYRTAGLMQDDAGLFQVFEACRKYGILPTVHAENGSIIDLLTDRLVVGHQVDISSFRSSRPEFTETEAVARVASIAESASSPIYVVHLSSGLSVQEVFHARKRGAQILVETCPQYLYLNNSLLDGPEGHLFSCCPPIRPAQAIPNLWKGVRTGAIQTVATDHCPFPIASKNLWNKNFTRLPMGMPGTETLLPLVLNRNHPDAIPLDIGIRAITSHPARIFGLYPQKGALLPGSDADLVVYDPEKNVRIHAASLHMNIDYSPYEGLEVRGWPIMTIARGKVIWEDSRFTGQAGAGRFFKRSRSDIAGFL